MKQKQPNPQDAERCIELRKQSKRGVRLHPGDQTFCKQMFQAYPAWYVNTEERVFNETAPFGSGARYGKRSKSE